MAAEGGDVVQARIVYWGIPGSGKTTNLRTIHSKLRSDNRGELSEVPTRLDPTVTFESLPIELGEVRGMRTRLQVIAVPGAPEQAPTRKQLLDEIDGVVLVLDGQPDRVEANLASVAELRAALADYGRSIDDVPMVVQLNKNDLADPSRLDSLHRALDLPDAAVFETVATEPGGPLRTLTTISKRVLRVLREQAGAPTPPAPAAAPAPKPAPVEPAASTRPAPAATPEAPAPQTTAPQTAAPQTAAPPAAPASAAELMEAAILREAEEGRESDAAAQAAFDAESALHKPWSELESEAKDSVGLRLGPDLRIVSVGTAQAVDQRAVRVPLVMGNDDGETVSFALTVQLDPLLDGEDP
ncbi:MAG: GTP-binding protein [Myxococcota bacterium]